MLRKTTAITIAFIVLSSVCHADDVDDYFRQAEEQWKEQVQIAEINARQGNLSPSTKAKDIAYLKELKKTGPCLHSLELKTGSVGIVGDDALILQRIDKSKALIKLSFAVGRKMEAARILIRFEDFTLLLKGVDLSDVADGDNVKLTRIMKITGTKTYETASGSNTVRVMEPVSLEDQDKILKKIEKIKDEHNAPKRTEAAAKTQPKKEAEPVNKETIASNRLKLAKTLMTHNPKAAKRRLKEIIDQYPQTKAAEEAKELLRKMDEQQQFLNAQLHHQ